MATLRIKDKSIKAKLAIFDKDGTIVDFCYTWEKVARARIKVMIEKIGISSSLANEVLSSFGIDPATGTIDPRGPLVQASQEDEVIITASVLYRSGYHWDEAYQIAKKVFETANNLYRLEDLTKSVPGIFDLLSRLKRSGIKIALATIDDYSRTLKILEITNLKKFFDFIVTGKDVKNTKPDPEMIFNICQKLKISPGESIMIGDTINDMIMGKNAGVALTVGVLNGVNSPEVFSGWADVVVNSLAEIKVEGEN